VSSRWWKCYIVFAAGLVALNFWWLLNGTIWLAFLGILISSVTLGISISGYRYARSREALYQSVVDEAERVLGKDEQ